MSLINIMNVKVLNNPAHFSSRFQFQIQFECLQDLQDGILLSTFFSKYLNSDLNWKLTYVGNAEDTNGDQVLEDLVVGPVFKGLHMFVLETPGPNANLILNKDLIGITVILLTCKFLGLILFLLHSSFPTIFHASVYR